MACGYRGSKPLLGLKFRPWVVLQNSKGWYGACVEPGSGERLARVPAGEAVCRRRVDARRLVDNFLEQNEYARELGI